MVACLDCVVVFAAVLNVRIVEWNRLLEEDLVVEQALYEGHALLGSELHVFVSVVGWEVNVAGLCLTEVFVVLAEGVLLSVCDSGMSCLLLL